MSKFSITAVFAFAILLTLNSCNSKNPDKAAVETDSIEVRNDQIPKRKLDDKDSADGNQNSHSKKLTPRKKYEFPEVY